VARQKTVSYNTLSKPSPKRRLAATMRKIKSRPWQIRTGCKAFRPATTFTLWSSRSMAG